MENNVNKEKDRKINDAGIPYAFHLETIHVKTKQVVQGTFFLNDAGLTEIKTCKHPKVKGYIIRATSLYKKEQI